MITYDLRNFVADGNNQLVCSLTKPRLVAPETSPALYNKSGAEGGGPCGCKNKLGKDDSRRPIDQYKEKRRRVWSQERKKNSSDGISYF